MILLHALPRRHNCCNGFEIGNHGMLTAYRLCLGIGFSCYIECQKRTWRNYMWIIYPRTTWCRRWMLYIRGPGFTNRGYWTGEKPPVRGTQGMVRKCSWLPLSEQVTFSSKLTCPPFSRNDSLLLWTLVDLPDCMICFTTVSQRVTRTPQTS